MDSKLIAIKLNFVKNIGEISDKRIIPLNKKLVADLPNRNILPFGVVFSKADQGINRSILIAPNQITYSEEVLTIDRVLDANYNKIKDLIKDTCDTLLLNYKFEGVINLTRLFPEGNSIEGSQVEPHCV